MIHGHVIVGKGSKVQQNVILGSEDGGKLSIGNNATIESGTTIYSHVKIGDDFCSGYNVVIKGNVEIGDSVFVDSNSVINGDCKIGNNVTIGEGAIIEPESVVIEDVIPRDTVAGDPARSKHGLP